MANQQKGCMRNTYKLINRLTEGGHDTPFVTPENIEAYPELDPDTICIFSYSRDDYYLTLKADTDRWPY